MSVLLAAALVAGLGVAGAVAYDAGRLNPLVCGGPCGPEAVAAPEQVTRAVSVDPVEATAQQSGPVDENALRAAVEPALRDEALGERLGLAVVGADGTTVLERDAGAAFVPASTTKVLVTYAALQTMDPQTRFSTRTVLVGDRVVLVGGGDPYLEEDDLEQLAAETATALVARGIEDATLGYDTSLFEGPTASPAWEDFYVPEQIVTPVSPLWVERGIEEDGRRATAPGRAAAQRFATLLRDAGAPVRGDPRQVEAPELATGLGEVESATLADVVDRILLVSDNEAAEVLLRHVALATGREGSFAGGTAAVQATLEEAGVPTAGLVLTDGSGLSRANRITPVTLARTLQGADARASTSRLLVDLPVAGLTGTLARRYADSDDEAGRGLVRAKTGTLTGVHSLAGYAVDRRGVPLYFAVMTDATDETTGLRTQEALDTIASAIASCACA